MTNIFHADVNQQIIFGKTRIHFTPRAKIKKLALKCPCSEFYLKICKTPNKKRYLYLSKCLIGDFK